VFAAHPFYHVKQGAPVVAAAGFMRFLAHVKQGAPVVALVMYSVALAARDAAGFIRFLAHVK
jgi:hypothetical protein